MGEGGPFLRARIDDRLVRRTHGAAGIRTRPAALPAFILAPARPAPPAGPTVSAESYATAAASRRGPAYAEKR
ncbi:hypothetical protein TPA0908_58830 [Micromonospora sp. AKA38]|nr:hypothetical protein TPA0908_58830 [Micromonospora sp. AKA38]